MLVAKGVPGEFYWPPPPPLDDARSSTGGCRAAVPVATGYVYLNRMQPSVAREM